MTAYPAGRTRRPFFFCRPFRIRKRMANVSCLMTLKFWG